MPKLDLEELSSAGCKHRVVSVRRLTDLQSEIECRIENQQFDSEFQQAYLNRFKFAPPQSFENAKSIVIVAMPRSPTKAVFNYKGNRQSFILPPTYTAYDQKRMDAEAAVAKAVGKLGYRTATASLPLKLLAVRSGLAEYGKNNIAYVDGMGSFMRLTAVFSDMPLESETWQAPKTMQLCNNCNLCQNACPTGAIENDGFMLHAERCLTFHNEKDATVGFPSWVKPEWHNCIVGCIRCQAACPKNKPYLSFFSDTVEFTEQETDMLLTGTTPSKMSTTMLDKLHRLSIMDYYAELPRNLSALFKKNMPMQAPTGF